MRIAPLIVALFAAACAAGDRAADAELDRWSLVPELRIGAVDDPEYALTIIGSVLPGPDGTILVSQPQEMTIRVFDREGRVVRNIGRSGDGPGEFRGLGRMGWRGDTLYVTDYQLRRINYFLADGTALASERVATPELEPPFIPSVPNSFMRDGSGILTPAYFVGMGSVDSVPLLRLGPGDALDTLLWMNRRNNTLSVAIGSSNMHTTQPFTDHDIEAVAPDGSMIVIVRRNAAEAIPNAEFPVSAIDAGGDTLWSVTIPYAPVPVAQEVVDSVLEDRTKDLGRERMPRAELRSLYAEAMYRPATWPPVSRLLIGTDNTIWLAREALPSDSTRWLVLDSTGSPQAELNVPSDVSLRYVDGDVLWAVQTDEFDVPYVLRYRLHRE